MNVAFFLIPKKDIVFLKDNATMRQALERMEYHSYSAVPLIDREGKYVGTITEGDLLWKLKNTPGLTFENTEDIFLSEVEQHVQNLPVTIDAEIEDLISRAVVQNFVPVVDDQQIFIGIVRRREMIEYCSKLLIQRRAEVTT
ncbi:CBS domain-containing protein [Desulfosporosinus sp. BICA1-9]|uniref:CBS domain-containing protein n=1 Tax=Desulfosporosinus sp. BICA1-9 TaxID=1531958 RepID=UPI00054C5F21|nr:CBS domain-containing protein [Desulfosporosinus sp. BICA1-9]KJS47586.1 MAG: inosine-5-monophosphate dehydrogenase [Peptococcaceae bacterium BRH_c23]KJS89684.1 MAG: inosine-5-monophosphate dehydrogenase [Desulfosporosinus sp. BICA1-9]HBW37107.1 CBS domain-containing protein [Desulfosporosinus sp.]